MRNKSALLSLLILAIVSLLAEVVARAQQQSSTDASPSEQIYVTGQVVAPQAIFFKQLITISRAITMAGGMLPHAGRDRVLIYRNNTENKTLMTMIIVGQKAIKKQRAEDILLQPYDVVEIVSKKLSKQLKRACPNPPCLKVVPRVSQKL